MHQTRAIWAEIIFFATLFHSPYGLMANFHLKKVVFGQTAGDS